MNLKEGMCVRTKDGAIAKAEQIIDNEIHFDIKPIFSDGECLGYNWFYIKDVVKASNNIIDLIEVGDYVNGYKVYYCYCADEDMTGLFIDTETKRVWLDKSSQIKSIVTKEQFESIKYSLEG